MPADRARRLRRAKIVATIGPASESDVVIGALIGAGMDVARINTSHGDDAGHRRAIAAVQRRSDEVGRPVGTLVDLQGPKIRIGALDETVDVGRGDVVRLLDAGSADGTGGDPVGIPTTYGGLSGDLRVGDRVLVHDGLVAFEATEVGDGWVEVRATRSGRLGRGNGINLPDTPISAPVLDARDEQGLRTAVEAGADLVALSFVRSASDAEVVRAAMRRYGDEVPLIAKIEVGAALDDLDAIIDAFDGVMVARGDLGVEVDLAEVPGLQKRIIDGARRAAKPVIVATEMLESMTHAPRPTRAEASDVANAVLDGADAVMLSGETAIGDHPVLVVETMAHLVEVAESGAPAPAIGWEPADVDAAFVASAVELARRHPEVTIGVVTRTGSSARRVASLRPPNRLVVLVIEGSHDAWALLWGAEVAACEMEDRGAESMRRALVDTFGIDPGTTIVAIAGHAPGRTDLIRRLDPV